MFVLTRLAEGLLAGHLFLLLSYIAGIAVTPAKYVRDGNQSESLALLRVATVCVIGMVVLGFSTLALALFGVMRPTTLALLAPCIIGVAALVRRASPFAASFWMGHLATLWDACTLPTIVVYFVMLVLAAPAVLPNDGGDPIHYHLAYALDWAHAGRLVIDPLLRFPFYASNFLLILSATLALNGATVINFITWSTGLLTAFLIYSCARKILDDASPRFWNTPTAMLLAIGVVASPVSWRWMATAYMDVPIAMLVLASVACLYVATLTNRSFWLFGSTAIAAFFIGCKPSFLVLLPFFVAAIALIGTKLAIRPRALWASLLMLGTLSSPWYIRNFILTGDPIPPVINLRVHGYDAFINKSEWAGITEDLGTRKSTVAFASLPIRAYLEPLTMDFREYGAPASVLLLFVPALYVLAAYSTGKGTPPPTTLFIGALYVLTAYWFGVSSLLRYALIVLPVLALSLACCGAALLRWKPQLALLLTVGATLAAVPTPASRTWYVERYRNSYRYASDVFTSDDAFLRVNDDGYAEEQFTVEQLRRRDVKGPVYIIGGATEYWFRRDGFQTAGDWVGPAGWYRLYRAIDERRADEFLRDLGVHVVLLDRSFVLGGLDVPLGRQLETAGFEAVTIPNSRYELYLKRQDAIAKGAR